MGADFVKSESANYKTSIGFFKQRNGTQGGPSSIGQQLGS